MSREWVLRKADESTIQTIRNDLSLSEELARVIVGRGASSSSEAKTYLEPELSHLGDPFLMADIDKACERLIFAVENKERIGIFGDYDVDGVCSTTVLWEFLESVGADVVARIPNRLIDGYGLNMRLIEQLKAEGVSVVVTVDCGITDHEEIDKAFAMGMEVIVVDHHTVPVQLPKAYAVINPHRDMCPMKATYLCAAGVVFYLCMALRKKLRDHGHFQVSREPVLRHLLDLVALATVADVMALKEGNRVLVKHGLGVLREKRRPGLLALMQVAGVESKKLTASTLGFQLGPRINAAGRLDDASVALRLLRMKDLAGAHNLAKLLDQHNQDRREEELRIVQEATAEVEGSAEHQSAYVLVVYHESWHPGVVGIVASRLVERFGKPAIVIGADGKGSGRSIPAFHLHEALMQVTSLMKGFGGHAHAVGLHVDPANIDRLRADLNSHAQKVLKAEDFVQKIIHDGDCEVGQASETFIDDLDRAAPFGRGNAEPVFLFRQVRFLQLKELRGGHLRGTISKHKEIPFVAFGRRDDVIRNNVVADVLGTLEVNEWNQNRNLQLRVKDVRVL
jgi:single-stranded-DNA-specific exonuclease